MGCVVFYIVWKCVWMITCLTDLIYATTVMSVCSAICLWRVFPTPQTSPVQSCKIPAAAWCVWCCWLNADLSTSEPEQGRKQEWSSPEMREKKPMKDQKLQHEKYSECIHRIMPNFNAVLSPVLIFNLISCTQKLLLIFIIFWWFCIL